MRPFILISFCLISSNLIAQITIDKSLSAKYNKAYDILPNQIKFIASNFEKDSDDSNYSNYFVVEISHRLDTLNKNQLKRRPKPLITIENIDSSNSKSHKSDIIDSTGDYIFFLCSSYLENDTLDLRLGFRFSEMEIYHRINKNHVSSTLRLSYKYDSVFKMIPDDQLTNDLSVPAKTIQFSLSDTSFTYGKIIYGSTEIITKPFYEFQNGQYLKLRWRLKYYFKFKVRI